MKIVDPHVHIWDLTTGLYPRLEKPSTGFIGNNASIARSYLLDELLAEGGTDFDIVKIVHIEAIPTDPIAESSWLQALADGAGMGLPQALVANVDLSANNAAEKLEVQSSFANLRGIRQILNRHPVALYNYVDKDYMADPVWCRNLALLRKNDLSFDMQLYPHQMNEACAVIVDSPDQMFVLNHGGMFADRNLAGWVQWRDGIRALARFENVTVKISGLGMFDHAWTVESFRPYVLELIDAFGVMRCMFASNFPVDKLFGTYGDLWRAYLKIVSDASDDEKRALFRENAERIYRI